MAAKAGKRKRRSAGLTWMLVIGGILIFVFVFLLMGGDKQENGVYVEQAMQRTVIASVSESGTVAPVTEVRIAADVSGEVVSLESKEGQMVKKGDVLVTIRPESYQSALEQARASLNAAIASELNAKANKEQAYVKYLQDSANFKRQDTLYRQNVIPKMEWENAKLQFDIARSQYRGSKASVSSARFQTESRRASLKTAQSDLRKTTIVSSMTGTVTQQNVKLGERVVGTLQMEGTELFRIADLSRMQVTVKINENDIVHVRIGDSARIEIDAYEGQYFRGNVTEIAYSASRADLGADQITSFEVKVEIDPASYISDKKLMAGLAPHQSPFRPGMSAQVEIFTERVDNAVTIPIQAVTIRKPTDAEDDAEPEEVVFTIDKNRVVTKRAVKTGISDDTYIEIQAGLQAGESIVSGPYKMLSKVLKDGQKVRLQRKEKEKK